MLKQLWQLLFPPKPEPIADQKITGQSNERLLSLESEIQSFRLTITDRDQTINKLRTEGDRYVVPAFKCNESAGVVSIYLSNEKKRFPNT